MRAMTAEQPSIPKPAPSITETTRFYWDAAREHRLLILRCDDCARYVHWPQAGCAFCGSPRLTPTEVSGKGTVYSFCIVHHIFHPGFQVPYNLAIVELDEQAGLRLLANIAGCPNEALAIGMPVEVTFEDREGYTLPQFRPATAGAARA